MERSEVAVIIPALNEERTIGGVVQAATRFGHVIVVSDGSIDSTESRVLAAGGEVLRHEKTLGYDAALNSGFRRANELGLSYAITLDADNQHDPQLIEKFITVLRQSNDVVLGVRDRKPRLAEKLFAGVMSLRYGWKDPLCGMKAYRISVYRKLGHFDSYGSIGTELALFAVRNNFQFAQIPVPVREREGKPRFGNAFRANYRILRSLFLGCLK